ncbi:bifunctional precorrin-2 dehydrogenase/sirohydrochlorin ferrochelatase [Halanaerobiaceae bacterium Z-7014]|uniref:precorrin-2 dehydrogenase n=1 Tax=Halonatronomonas betaini TaxID=2778430 RepID=A0A931F7B8_9FIRM|nr:bifunctional precorrin-2 dehydrogenase/sirohydrochlorin ferrochelatase [Halonatronomonas betaini]MBF8437785.1 bifunctional precorrin-2 dehydrogenase/sirohydrochlorin ferrochelatase [Halonatronomonas betaini]
MAGLPVFLKLEDKKVAVIGGGSVASRKVSSLVEAGAEIVVISPEINARLEGMVEAGLLEWRQKSYEYGDLKGFWLVIAATSDSSVNHQVYQEAKEMMQLYNIADRPDLSTFYTAARVKKGDLQIAISTGGKAPALSAEIRRELADKFGDCFGEYLEFAGEVREWLLENEDLEERRRILRAIASREIFDNLLAGDLDRVFREMEKAIPERFFNERAL